ncbi:NtaA/DmoA family FMN-dependent monooxygenase [Microbacterium thalassium]|uniref:FMN-dependent oxidoreductase (Nitrilotriacetate monooxygenase family) n=1 Tax=Microbacterium thalassium TaxID=362649 RepID=A0A7X0KU27_9MICO|nr:NtaA/DmoA family FMN-dependent monooxygenase [Microbacterium thalassium]MBB6390663.1 FMN-dependent oxidoreductase (nitrilotriacetate monooxygenase family) [Microbacterium thalassium]GLK25772.1 monooxygenase [Microbacterium thalassium]
MATRPDRRMILTMFMLTTGFQIDSWRDPRSRIEDVGSLDLIADMARAAEAAKLHAVFFGDGVDVGTIRDNNIRNTGLYEPISSIGALIGVTDKIGLVGSLSTSFFEPYNAARQFAGLDRLSGGRVGWNIVTSLFGGAQNFGLDAMPSPEARYDKAAEFVDVVGALWDSWTDDTVIADRVSGQWARTEGIVDIDHSGAHFRVAGALNMMRPPQGHPVLFQAGQSAPGMRLGGTVADAIYTAQSDKRAARAYADGVREIAAAAGRDPHDLKVLPGVVPIVAETASEAEELSRELAGYIDLDAGRRRLGAAVGFSVADLDADEAIPAERFAVNPGNNSRWETWRRMAVDEKRTVREMIVDFARAGGHRILIGSPGEVADSMIDWFEDGACDGFNLDPPSIPVGMRNMLDLLVPELQERGYFQTEYSGDTLRERMGLPRPTGRRLQVPALAGDAG